MAGSPDQSSRSCPDRRGPARLTRLLRPQSAWPLWRGSRIARVSLTVVHRHWAVTGVLALYALAALIVPTRASTLVSDDWIFVRSVETLVRTGDLEILPISAPTAVFHVAWGALFATVFGFSFGAIRLSTVVLVGLSACAFYGLCRELGTSPARSALGTAVYLFNPLLFVLSFSFMTDAPFTALLVITTACYERGLRQDTQRPWWIVVGSIVAALAFLVRPHGALIPLTVAGYLYLFASRRLPLRPSRTEIVRLLQVVAIPATVAIAYALWSGGGVPSGQEAFIQEIESAGWDGTQQLVQRLAFVAAMYLGFFTLPVVVGALPGLRGLVRSIPPAGWLLFTLWEAVIIAGLAFFAPGDRRMPYVPQFVALWGLGPTDVAGAGAPLVDLWVLDAVTAVCAAAALLLGLVLVRGVGVPATPERGVAGMVLAVGIGQVVGVLPPSFPFRDWILSLDRYLLPLLPFAVWLGLWALRDVRFSLPAGCVVAAVVAAFSVAGTRDFLVLQHTTWNMARAAVCAGVPLTKLDGGYAWDGYHLWGATETNPEPAPPEAGPWWVWWWTPGNIPATDSTYVVSASPLPGYDEVAWIPYDRWLRTAPERVYLLHRQGTPLFHALPVRCGTSPSSGTGWPRLAWPQGRRP